MANGPLSPVMLIASAGLLDNQGLIPSANLSSAISQYLSLPVVSSYMNVVSVGDAILDPSTMDSLETLGNTSLPALTNVVLGNLSTEIGNTYPFTSIVTSTANTIMGNGDLSKFAQTYGICNGYKFTANQFLASTNNTGPLDATFINMDALTTGGLSLVSNDLSSFASDLSQIGVLINLADLSMLGFPSALLRQVLAQGGLLPVLRTTLRQNSVSDQQITELVENPLGVLASTEKNIYKAMTEIKGADLEQVLFMLDVSLTSLANMADLLDPKKILPNSYSSLLLWTSNGILDIYLDGTPNSSLQIQFSSSESYQTLSKIIPSDQALANSAWSRSLFQIQNIANLTLPQLAISAGAVESNNDLADISSLSQPVPSSTVSAITDALSPSNVVVTATGTNGKFTLFDFIGTAAGWPHTSNLIAITANIDLMQSSGDLSTLTDSPNGAFTVMNAVLLGTYGNPTTGPVNGLPAPFNAGQPFANADVCFTVSLIPLTTDLVANIVNTSSYSVNIINDWTSMNQQIVREGINQTAAQLDFSSLQANSKPTLLSLASGLHEIGTSAEPQGPADFFSEIADAGSQAGQSIIASLREGRSIKALENAGVGTNTQLSAD